MRQKSIDSKQKSILKMIKPPATKQIQIRMPIELIKRFDELKKDANALGHTLSLSEICVQAAQEAIDIADKELAKLLEGSELKIS
jgi:hypothetical protein